MTRWTQAHLGHLSEITGATDNGQLTRDQLHAVHDDMESRDHAEVYYMATRFRSANLLAFQLTQLNGSAIATAGTGSQRTESEDRRDEPSTSEMKPKLPEPPVIDISETDDEEDDEGEADAQHPTDRPLTVIEGAAPPPVTGRVDRFAARKKIVQSWIEQYQWNPQGTRQDFENYCLTQEQSRESPAGVKFKKVRTLNAFLRRRGHLWMSTQPLLSQWYPVRPITKVNAPIASSVAVPSTSTGRPTRAVRLTKRQREVSVESEATLTNRIRDTTYVDLGDQPPMANQGSSDPQSARIHQLIGYARAYGEWREGGRLAFYEWIVVQENDSINVGENLGTSPSTAESVRNFVERNAGTIVQVAGGPELYSLLQRLDTSSKGKSKGN